VITEALVDFGIRSASELQHNFVGVFISRPYELHIQHLAAASQNDAPDLRTPPILSNDMRSSQSILASIAHHPAQRAPDHFHRLDPLARAEEIEPGRARDREAEPLALGRRPARGQEGEHARVDAQADERDVAAEG